MSGQVSGGIGVTSDSVEHPPVVGTYRITVAVSHRRRTCERLARRGPEGAVEQRPGKLVQHVAHHVWILGTVACLGEGGQQLCGPSVVSLF